MTVSSRISYDFDTSKFGGADTLSSGASNTLNLVASSTGGLPAWHQKDLTAGPITRTDYFQNPMVSYINSLNSVAANLKNNGILTAGSNNSGNMVTSANNVIIELPKFLSHTNNVSGVSVVTDATVPSLGSAQSMGQLNMMTLAKSDGGVSDTGPILGSFTSLFIKDDLSANIAQLIAFDTQFAASMNTTTTSSTDENGQTVTSTVTITLLSPTQVDTITNYLTSTQNLLYTRRMSDWTFYRNSTQLAKDAGFLQQFEGMGGTMSFLVNNVVGTPSLLAKLNS